MFWRDKRKNMARIEGVDLQPEQLDRLMARIALYLDSLLTQVLAAATYPDQIPDAARWADQHHYLTGQTLANAI